YFTNELARLKVGVRLSCRLEDARLLRRFDAIVLATGVIARKTSLAGSDLPHVLSYPEVLLHGAAVGDRVAIVGAGGIGVDVAHYLSFGETNADESSRFLYEQGLAAPPDGALLVVGRKEVALMRRGATIGEGIGKTTRWAVLRALRAAGVETLANVRYDAIVPGGIRIRAADGAERTIEADTVVIAAGQERNDALLEPIRALGIPFRVVGGAKEAGELNAVRAFEEGLRAAHELAATLGLPSVHGPMRA
ncbi:MAG: FAD-dependent oxidoreductase, partial [Candidatus Cybelea sp.]